MWEGKSYGTATLKLAGSLDLFDFARTHSSRKNLEAPTQGSVWTTLPRCGLLSSFCIA
jgi:hypothetical protein